MLDHALDTPAIRIGHSLNGLSAIQNPDCGASVWPRPTTSDFQAWVDALPPEHLPKDRIILAPKDVQMAVIQICEQAGTPDGAHRDHLIHDVTQLAQHFAVLMSAKWLRLRLDVITTDACRKFHIDAVTARLLCTFRGTGTQFGIAEQGAEPANIQTVPTGAVTILRGTLWPTVSDTNLRHRSPPISGTGETRLMLVLDPLDAPMEEVCY